MFFIIIKFVFNTKNNSYRNLGHIGSSVLELSKRVGGARRAMGWESPPLGGAGSQGKRA